MIGLSTIAGMAASLGGAGLSYLGQKKTNKANVNLAREQMDFQERMSNSAYQRATDDMREAGINPILAYSQGGASTPIGATAQMQNPMASATTAMGQMADAGSQIASTASNIETQDSQRKKMFAEIKVLGEQANLTNTQIHKTQTELDKIRKEIAQIQANTTGIEADNVAREIMADFYNSAEFMRIAKSIGINPSLLKMIGKAVLGRK